KSTYCWTQRGGLFLDPAVAVSVSGGKLLVGGGTGVDGQTLVQFIEKIELGGVVILQHGNIIFDGASDGIVGGLYASGISAAGCLAGFQITPFGTQSKIQAIVNGTPTGALLNTQT